MQQSTCETRDWKLLFESSMPTVGNQTGVPYTRASHPTLNIVVGNIEHQSLSISQDINEGIGAVVWDCVRIMR